MERDICRIAESTMTERPYFYIRSEIWRHQCVHPRLRFPVRREYFGDSPINKGYTAYFYCTCAKQPYFYFLSEIWRHRRVPRPRFSMKHMNCGDSQTFEAGLFMFAWIFRTSWPKNKRFYGQNRGRICAILTTTNSFLLCGVITFVSNLVKSIKKCDRKCAHTDANWFLLKYSVHERYRLQTDRRIWVSIITQIRLSVCL